MIGYQCDECRRFCEGDVIELSGLWFRGAAHERTVEHFCSRACLVKRLRPTWSDEHRALREQRRAEREAVAS